MSGKVEVLAKKGRPPSLNEGDLASLRKWIGDGDKASDCRTPAQLGARMAKVTQTIGTPYVDGTPSASYVLRAKKYMPSFGSTSNGISTKQARIDTYDVDAIAPYLTHLGKILNNRTYQIASNSDLTID